MSLSALLATNLRRLCETRESISAVARATGINRQQFGRYLAGAALPNQSTRGKIARYFAIPESELFLDDRLPPRAQLPPHRAGPAEEGVANIAAGALSPWLEAAERSSVAPGLYYADFADVDDPGTVMRSTLIVKAVGNRTVFRRLTCHAEEKSSWWSHFGGDHTGVILDRRNWIYLLGLDGIGSHEPTLLVVQYLDNLDPMLGGHAALLGTGGPAVTAVVITRCPSGCSLPSALKQSHAYSVDDPAIDPFILDAIGQQCAKLLQKIQSLAAYSSGLRPPGRAGAAGAA
jgi:transcriptional regulator with XRE-family HTH domain